VPQATASKNTNFKAESNAKAKRQGQMKLRISKTLKFWVDVVSEVLHEFEQAGDAMRYLRADGKIGWKPTQWMLDRLADGERDARDDATDG
jgi:hypothetical protein